MLLSSFCSNASPLDTIHSHFSIRWDCDIKSQIIGMDVSGIKSIFCFSIYGHAGGMWQMPRSKYFFLHLIQFSLPPFARKIYFRFWLLAFYYFYLTFKYTYGASEKKKSAKSHFSIELFDWKLESLPWVVSSMREISSASGISRWLNEIGHSTYTNRLMDPMSFYDCIVVFFIRKRIASLMHFWRGWRIQTTHTAIEHAIDVTANLVLAF